MRGGRGLEVVSALGPSELLAAVVRTCPAAARWRGVGEVRVGPFGRGDAAVGLVVGRPDRAPRAVFGAATRPSGGSTVLTVGDLERRGRGWTPWRARAYRATHARFLEALAVEIGRVDVAASVHRLPGAVSRATPVTAGAGVAEPAEPVDGAVEAPFPRERREVGTRLHDPAQDGS